MKIFDGNVKVILVPNDEFHAKILRRKFDKEIPERSQGTVHFFFNRRSRKWIGILYCCEEGTITKKEFKHCLSNLLKVSNLTEIAFSGFEKSKSDFKRSVFVSLFSEYFSNGRNIKVFYYPVENDGARIEIQKSDHPSSLKISKVVGSTFFSTTSFR